jgi:hypothetical protein
MANEDPQYKAWIKTRPCAVCNRPGPSDPHHLPRRHGGPRSHDHTAVPVCRRCHNDIQHPKSLRGLFEGKTAEWYWLWHTGLAGKLMERYEGRLRRNADIRCGPVVAEVTLRRRPNGDPF